MAQSRADTVIILHVTAAHDRAYLVSVPRDLMVQAKSFKKSRYGGGRAKMTETFFFGAQNGAGVAGAGSAARSNEKSWVPAWAGEIGAWLWLFAAGLAGREV